jgi:hypothetical protein
MSSGIYGSSFHIRGTGDQHIKLKKTGIELDGTEAITYDAGWKLDLSVCNLTKSVDSGTWGQYLQLDGSGNLTYGTPAGGGSASELVNGSRTFEFDTSGRLLTTTNGSTMTDTIVLTPTTSGSFIVADSDGSVDLFTVTNTGDTAIGSSVVTAGSLTVASGGIGVTTGGLTMASTTGNISIGTTGTFVATASSGDTSTKGTLTVDGLSTLKGSINVDSAGNAFVKIDRASTTYSGVLRFLTGGTEKWTLGATSVTDTFSIGSSGGSIISITDAAPASAVITLYSDLITTSAITCGTLTATGDVTFGASDEGFFYMQTDTGATDMRIDSGVSFIIKNTDATPEPLFTFTSDSTPTSSSALFAGSLTVGDDLVVTGSATVGPTLTITSSTDATLKIYGGSGAGDDPAIYLRDSDGDTGDGFDILFDHNSDLLRFYAVNGGSKAEVMTLHRTTGVCAVDYLRKYSSSKYFIKVSDNRFRIGVPDTNYESSDTDVQLSLVNWATKSGVAGLTGTSPDDYYKQMMFISKNTANGYVKRMFMGWDTDNGKNTGKFGFISREPFAPDYAYRVLGYIYEGNTTANMNYTLNHFCIPKEDSLRLTAEQHIGEIVVATGIIKPIDARIPSISDAVPEVELCNVYKSKASVGIITGTIDEDGATTRDFKQSGMITTVMQIGDDGLRIQISSGGEGLVRINNRHGNIELGDLICSDIDSCGTKQDSEFVMSYTVAKCLQPCTFDLESTDYVCTESDGVRYALLGCFYIVN